MVICLVGFELGSYDYVARDQRQCIRVGRSST